MREGLVTNNSITKRPSDIGEDRPTVMLKFIKNKDGILSSTHDGMPAFLQKDQEKSVKGKEVWMCQLTKHDREGCWYARPFMKLDGEFFMELNSKRIREMADCLWETKRDMIISALEQDAVSKQEKEIETLKKELSEWTEASKHPRGNVDSAEGTHEEIQSLKNEIDRKETAIAKLETKVAKMDRMDKEAKALREKNSEQKKDLERLRDIEEIAKRTEGEIRTLKSEIGNKEAAIAELESKVARNGSMERDIKALKEEILKLEDDLGCLKGIEKNARRFEEEIMMLKCEIDSKDSAIAEMETTIAENDRKAYILLKQKDMEAAEKEKELLLKKEVLESLIVEYGRKEEGESKSEENAQLQPSIRPNGKVFHVGADEIFSNHFGDGRYDVAISADGKTLTAKENAKGKTVCEGGSLLLSGLERFLPFKESKELKTLVKENLFLIELKEVSA